MALKDYEFTDYKFKSKASKRARHRMHKGFRAREKEEVQRVLKEAAWLFVANVITRTETKLVTVPAVDVVLFLTEANWLALIPTVLRR